MDNIAEALNHYFDDYKTKLKILLVLGTFGTNGTTLENLKNKYFTLTGAQLNTSSFYNLIAVKQIVIRNYDSLVGMSNCNSNQTAIFQANGESYHYDDEKVKQELELYR